MTRLQSILLLSLFLLFNIIACGDRVSNSTNDTNQNKAGVDDKSADNDLNRLWVKYKFTESEIANYGDMVDQTVIEYIRLFPLFTLNQVDSSLHLLVKKSEANLSFFNYLKGKLTTYLSDPNSPLRNDIYFEKLLCAYQNSSLLSDVDKERDRLLLDIVRRNQVGTKATDFYFFDNQGKKNSLYALDNRKKLLVFYDPTCVHCQEVITQMKESVILKNAISSDRIIVLAVDPLGNLEEWKKYQSNIPNTWMNGFDKSGLILKETLYSIKAYPTLYLLDNNNDVLEKDSYFSIIERLL